MSKRPAYPFILLLFLWLGCTLVAQAQQLTARLDRDHIGIEETFTLTLRYQGQTGGAPDFSSLRRDFEIVHTQQSSQMQNINGQIASFLEWRLTLAPLKSGVFTIPALSLGNQSSQPLIITVDPQKRPAADAQGNEISVEIELDKNTAHVQEQIIFTIRLITPVSLEQILLDPLQLDHALVISLDETEYQTSINGTPHGVVQTRFALFPQRSGTLTIPSLTYQVLPASGRRGLFNQIYGAPNTNVLRLRTEEKQLTIKSTPPEAAGLPWLPASNLQLDEHWSRDVENLKVGEPVTRSIKMIADGLTPGQITPLNMAEQEGLTFYPDQAQTDEQKTTRGIQGTRIETQAIVPTRSGSFTLPAVRVQWWDTVNQQMRTAELPERQLKVEDTPFTLGQTSPATHLANTDEGVPMTAVETRHIKHLPLWLIILTAFTSLTSLLFAFLYWRTRRDLSAIRRLFVEEHEQQQIAEDKAWRLLKHASADKDLPALRKAVLTWARIHWQNPNLHSLQAVATQTDNQRLREHLLKLDTALYGNLKESWDAGEMLQEIYASKKAKRDRQATDSPLNPLYQGQ